MCWYVYAMIKTMVPMPSGSSYHQVRVIRASFFFSRLFFSFFGIWICYSLHAQDLPRYKLTMAAFFLVLDSRIYPTRLECGLHQTVKH